MKRYLWAVGRSTDALKPGVLYANRYRYKGSRIFLDEKPAQLPGNLDEVPGRFIPYLKLSPNRIHIPQVYDWLQVDPGSPDSSILLLDQAPLYVPKSLVEQGVKLPPSQIQEEVQLFPELLGMWTEATPLRQLHWLWQMANLWHSMNTEGVLSSLLTPELLRVEGPILRLLELRTDTTRSLPLGKLGEFWLKQFVVGAKPSIQTPLKQICQELTQGKIRNPDELISALDQTMLGVQGAQQPYQVRVATLTDQGPSRQRNEDACFPASGTVADVPPASPLVIVCDGIGGHQGGDVASNLAIKAIEERVLGLAADRLDATTLAVELEKAVCEANDRISQQNDSEQRFDRQRMGTTVVMGLMQAHQLYVAHVGDSRAYWVTRWGCHQITQDDDVASREVRLGYSTYPQALQQPSSGSLVQALGMGHSTNLYPTVQRFIVDEDSVFLFCSDGLSDNDQVEKFWQETLLPLLNSGAELGTVSHWLVDIANTQNGYDNATVGLLLCKVGNGGAAVIPSSQMAKTAPAATVQPFPATSLPREPETAIFAPSAAPDVDRPPPTSTPTQRIEPAPSSRSKQPSLILSIALLAMLAGGILAAINWFYSLQPQRSQSPPTPNASPAEAESPMVGAATSGDVVELEASERFQANTGILAASELPTRSRLLDRQIPLGSVVYAVKQATIGDADWIQVKVCTLSAAPTESLSPESSSPESSPVPSSADPGLVSIDSSNLDAPSDPAVAEAKPSPSKSLTPSPASSQVQLLQSGGVAWINSYRYQELQKIGTLQPPSSETLVELGEDTIACLSSNEALTSDPSGSPSLPSEVAPEIAPEIAPEFSPESPVTPAPTGG